MKHLKATIHYVPKDTGRLLHVGDSRYLFGLCFDATAANDVPKEDTRWDTEDALGGIQFPSVLP